MHRLTPFHSHKDREPLAGVGCWPPRRDGPPNPGVCRGECSLPYLPTDSGQLFTSPTLFMQPLEPATGAPGPSGQAQGTGRNALSEMARQGKRRSPTATPPRGPAAASTAADHLTQPSTPTGTQKGEKRGEREGKRRSLVPCPASETVRTHSSLPKPLPSIGHTDTTHQSVGCPMHLTNIGRQHYIL